MSIPRVPILPQPVPLPTFDRSSGPSWSEYIWKSLGRDYPGDKTWPGYPCLPGEDSTPTGCKVACRTQGAYGDLIRSVNLGRCVIPAGAPRNVRGKAEDRRFGRKGYWF